MHPNITFSHNVSTPFPQHFEKHMHNNYELFLFLRGDANYAVEGAIYQMRPWDLLLIRPRTFHQLRPLSATPYERFIINFSEEIFPSSFHGDTDALPTVTALMPDSLPYHLFSSWKQYEKNFTKEEMEEYVSALIPQVLLHLKHAPESAMHTPVHTHPVLVQILQYIDTHPTEQITAASLSARFFVSSSWIVHTVRQEMGLSLMQYIEKKRILYAQRLLQDGKTPTEVAEHCGYESYVTFYRQYKRVLGISPKQKQKANLIEI